MDTEHDALAMLLAKDEIRELVLLYSRGVDRNDTALLRSLYARNATDTHGDTFDGSAEDYIAFLERSLPHMRYSGHHVCNHLIRVDGDEGEGEVYALAYHVIPDRNGGWIEDLRCVRYMDRYRKEDGLWRFARRVVSYDMGTQRPFAGDGQKTGSVAEDPSYTVLSSRLFARGARA